MYFSQVVPLLFSGLSLVDALTTSATSSKSSVKSIATNASAAPGSVIDMSKVLASNPALQTLSPTIYTPISVDTSATASSILSVLESKHAATAIPTGSSGAFSSTSTKSSSSTTTKTTLSTSSSSSSTKSSSSSSSTKTSSSTSSSSSSKSTSSTSSSSKNTTSSSTSKTLSKKAIPTINRLITTKTVQKRAVAANTTSTSSVAACTQSSSILYGYTPASPNNGTTFLLDTTMAALSTAAYWPPAGYSTSFLSQFAELSASNYMGYIQLSAYDTAACASYCNAASGCQAFNIYFERTPTYVPNNTTCTNPAAQAAVGCALYGSYVDATQALNIGQYKNDFVVVIQGSNGYNAYIDPPTVTNYTQAALAGALATSNTYYIGYNYWATYDVNKCATFCYNTTRDAQAAAATNKKTTFTPCNYFLTFNLTNNGNNYGMYCQIFSNTSATSGTIVHQTVSNNVTYNLTYAYGYSLFPPNLGLTAVTWSPAPTGDNATCNSLGVVGTNVTDYNQVTYTIACGYDLLYQLDIGSASAPDFYSCFNLCDKFTGCDSFAYLWGVCYFKHMAGSNKTPQISDGTTLDHAGFVDLAWRPDLYAGFAASSIASTIASTTTTTTAWTGASTVSVTVVKDLTVTVIVSTPGGKSYVGPTVITTATDSGKASTVAVNTITAGGTTTIQTVWPTACGTMGHRWAMYSNGAAGQQGASNYPSFTPETYKKSVPTSTGTAVYLAEDNAQAATVSVYGAKQTMDVTVLDQTFFVYAGRGTGYYTFQIPYADDIELVWIGANAVSGWKRTNADLVYVWAGPNTPVMISYYLTGFTYTPVRVMWANGGGPGDEQLKIYAADGTVFMSSTPSANAGYMSPHIMQSPCNVSIASAWPAWGKET